MLRISVSQKNARHIIELIPTLVLPFFSYLVCLLRSQNPTQC